MNYTPLRATKHSLWHSVLVAASTATLAGAIFAASLTSELADSALLDY